MAKVEKGVLRSRVPLWHSMLRIRCCHCSSSGHCYDSGSIPGPGTSHTHTQQKKKKKKKEKRKKEKRYTMMVGLPFLALKFYQFSVYYTFKLILLDVHLFTIVSLVNWTLSLFSNPL